MKLKEIFAIAVILCLMISCASKEKKWGKEFDIEGKWWEQNGQSYDPNTKVFLAVGMSRGNYGSKRLERDSADMDARKQIANFMQSMVSTYVYECNKNNVDASENMVKAVSKELLVGSAIIDRHYSGGEKIYFSLVKIDLKYFFNKVKDRILDTSSKSINEKYKNLDPALKEDKTKTDLDALEDRIQKVENKVSKRAEKIVTIKN